MAINTPTSSIEGNNEAVIELLSNKHIFEAISNIFFKREKKSDNDALFEDENERKMFLSEHLNLVIYNLNKRENFNKFIQRLEEIYLKNNDDFGFGIIEKLKTKKFVFIDKGTGVTVQLEDKKGDKINGVSTKILMLAESLKVEVEALLSSLLKHDKSFFEKLNTNLSSKYYENGEVLGKTDSDIALLINNSNI